jgi:hypothetical protein
MSIKAFLRGMGRVVDLFGLSGPATDLPETDEEAFRRDWEALGKDYAAINDDVAQFWNDQRQNDEETCTYPCHYCGDMCKLKDLSACRMGFICYKCEAEKTPDPNDPYDFID